MALQKSNPNYVFRNDVNELVERLEILVASKGAGNSHNNEIFSILEELHEERIIF